MEVMGLNIGAPEAVVLSFSAYAVLKSCLNHGKKVVPAVSLTGLFSGLIVIPAALSLGGFFEVLGLPQVIYGCLYAIQLIGLWAFVKGGKSNESQADAHNAPAVIMISAAILGLYYWGGFFA